MILSLLADHNITPRRVSTYKGGEYHSPCPRCGGEDRFHTWPQQYDGQGSFWCRQCDIGGDCIKFLMEYNGLSFRQAAERTGKQLDDRTASNASSYAAPQPPQQKVKDQPSARECRTPAESWQASARELLDKAQDALLDNTDQLDYLAGRGLPVEAVRRYGLGWIGTAERNCMYSSRKKWGIPPKEKNKRPDALWLPRGIVIPNIIADGGQSRIDSLRIRRPKADRVPPTEKIDYHVVPEGGTAPLLLHDRQPAIVVVEAQLDGMLCHHAAGDLVGVLALGNSTARPDERALAALKKAGLILVALDFDDNNAGGKAWDRWKKQFDQAVRFPVPKGKDPGEAYAAGVDIRLWIQSGLPDVWRRSANNPDKNQQGPSAAPVVPEHIKGQTVNGHEYVIATSEKDIKRLRLVYPGAVIFMPDEIRLMKGLSQDVAEKALLYKKHGGLIGEFVVHLSTAKIEDIDLVNSAAQIFETRLVETRAVDHTTENTPLPDEPEAKQEEIVW